MTELTMTKAIFDLMQDDNSGKHSFSIHAPCYWRGNVVWPHAHISYKNFKKESRGLQATVEKAWSERDEERAAEHLSLLLYRYRDLNKERLALKLPPLAHKWINSCHPVEELYIDWDYLDKKRDMADLSLRISKVAHAKRLDPPVNDKLTLDIIHWHVERHFLRPHLYESWYRNARCFVNVKARAYKNNELCISCRRSLNSSGPVVSNPSQNEAEAENEDEDDEESELPPYMGSEK